MTTFPDHTAIAESARALASRVRYWHRRDAFRTWCANLGALGFMVGGCWVLSVSSRPDAARWLRVEIGPEH